MSDKRKQAKIEKREYNKAHRIENRAIKKLRSLLIRVWFIKNWFTILIIGTVILLAFTLSGMMPETLPIIGPYSYALKNGLQQFLEIGDQEFYSLFGSITGIFSLLFSVGFASSKIKAVSYYMIDKDKIKFALAKVNLSLNDKGKIVTIENRIGMDLDGDQKIGITSIDVSESSSLSFLGDMFGTVDELKTILTLDKAILKAAVVENPGKDKINVRKIGDTAVEIAQIFIDPVPPTVEGESGVPEVVFKKPSTPIAIKRR